MNQRSFVPVVLLVLLVAAIGGAGAAPNQASGQDALVQVFLSNPSNVDRFGGTGLPVFARLTGSAGDYLLTGGNAAHLQSLTDAGLQYAGSCRVEYRHDRAKRHADLNWRDRAERAGEWPGRRAS